MNKLLNMLCGEPSSRDARKALTVKLVYITSALIALVIIALIITLAVSGNQGNDGGASSSKGKLTLSYDDTKTGTLLVVNKSSAAYDFTLNPESELVSMGAKIPTVDSSPIYTLRANNNDMKANSEALNALNALLSDFYRQSANKESAKKLTIWTAYRSYDAQYSLGSSTKAGQSDFHTGMLFELTYDNTATSIYTSNEYDWIYKNAHKYGFIERYPERKSSVTGVGNFDNAFRYVGIPHATYIYEHSLCLEEYVEKVKTYTQDSPLEITADAKSYSVFYVAASLDEDTVISGISKSSTAVSGTNGGGFIVTVKK